MGIEKFMSKDLYSIKSKILPVLKKHRVLRSSLFGSFVSGEQTKNSDIDILVHLPDGSTLFDLIDLKQELGTKLGREVDVLTFNSIHPLLKKEIMKNQFPIYTYEKRRP